MLFMENRLFDELKIKRQNDFHMISVIKIKGKMSEKQGNSTHMIL
jgi:hypothetical protein